MDRHDMPRHGPVPAGADLAGEGGRAAPPDRAKHLFWHAGHVSHGARARQFGYAPSTIWLTGLSGAGKSTVAYALEQLLHEQGWPSLVLDGDNLRHHLNSDLGFSAADRRENIRRTAEVARLMNDAGLTVISAFISPYLADRALACALIGPARFIEVHVCTAVAVCEARDCKGLYAKARAGTIGDFTGVSAPYEAPLAPALTLDTAQLCVAAAAHLLYQHLLSRGA